MAAPIDRTIAAPWMAALRLYLSANQELARAAIAEPAQFKHIYGDQHEEQERIRARPKYCSLEHGFGVAASVFRIRGVS